MNTSPILFKAPMVQAILAGRKTMTRRILAVQPPDSDYKLLRLESSTDKAEKKHLGKWHWAKVNDDPRITQDQGIYFKCPYGKVGDHLWVRETWADNFSGHVSHAGILYRATAATDKSHHGNWAKEVAPNSWVDYYDRPFKWRPSIFMPRRISRITLKIEAIRIERLQQIDEKDARAEGIAPTVFTAKDIAEIPANTDEGKLARALGPGQITAKCNFEMLWCDINGKDSWKANPYVWVIEFSRVKGSINGR